MVCVSKAARRALHATCATAAAGLLTLALASTAGAEGSSAALSRSDAADERGKLEHVVTEGVASPSGIVVDLFNYDAGAVNASSDLNFVWNNYGWQGGNWGTDPACDRSSINAWTGRWDRKQGGPYMGVVESRLDGGYPVLKEGQIYSSDIDRRTQRASLAYLFDSLNPGAGVKAFHDVHGLLRLDEAGYYYYDSMENFASFDESAGAFTLYDAPGVKTNPNLIADVSVGQFFPFNTYEQVFTEKDGKLESPLCSHDSRVDHHFGLSMTSYFMQPVDGMTDGNQMVFDFSGDDDVWVFIDDVLVGDVGGIHDRIALTINFATGEVITSDASSYAHKPNPTVFTKKKFSELFDANVLENGRFKDNTYHTMKFFYLERGSKNSNLSLKTNLVQIPASTMTKVDQMGKPVAGARFELYEADGAYQIIGDVPISAGATGSTGVLTFRDATGKPLNFMELQAHGKDRFVLRETYAPEGYRKSPEAHLRYVLSEDKLAGHLVSENYWESGVYARAEKVITVVGDVVEDAAGVEHKVDDGRVFGVVLKRDRSVDDLARSWHAVWGDSVGGWHLTDKSITDVKQLRDAALIHPFERDESGKLVADIRELPGLPEQYYHMASEQDRREGNYEYVVGLYFTTAASQDKMDASNTWRLGGEKHFDRQSAAHLHVTDRANYVFVQKVDDEGTPLNGVDFDVYDADAMTRSAGGDIVPLPGAKPIETQKTADRAEGPDWDLQDRGVATFGPYGPGTYYVVERASTVPAGYVPESHPIRVVVDDNGAHPDAGGAHDGVYAMVGVGRVLRSMAQFAQEDGIDSSLHDIVISPMEPTGVSVDEAHLTARIEGWQHVDDPAPVALSYGARDTVLEYGPRVEGGPVALLMDEGYGYAHVEQDPDGAPAQGELGLTGYTDLSGRDLSNLYGGAARIVVTNERVASLAVSKHVEVPAGQMTPEGLDTIPFDLEFAFGGSAGGSYKAATFKAVDGAEVQQGQTYRLKSGDVRQIHHGETIKVYGLPDGAACTVTERMGKDAAYRQVKPVDAQGAPVPFEGTAQTGKTLLGEFVNAYAPAPVTVAGDAFGFDKHLDLLKMENGEITREEDGAWQYFKPGETTFTIRLSEVKEGAGALECPFPPGLEVHKDEGGDYVTASVSRDEAAGYGLGDFGPITFDAPGTYTYLVSEELPDPTSKVPGLTYSRARYRVVVTVVDEGGVLRATTAMRQTFDETGAPLPPEQQAPVQRAVFRNSASFDATEAGPVAKKVLDDQSGDHDLAMGEFTFAWRAVTEGAPLLTVGQGSPGEQPAGTDYYTTTNDAMGAVTFGTARFTEKDLDNSYVYELFEVVPADAVNPAVDGGQTKYGEASPEQRSTAGWCKDGVTYDVDSVFYHVAVNRGSEENGVAHINVDVAYRDGGQEGSQLLPEGAVFTNTYDPDDAVVTIEGEKTLVGRPSLAGETFTFELVAGNDAAQQGLEDDTIVFGSNPGASSMLANLDTLAKDEARGFAFDRVTFARAGVYVFHVSERVPENPAPGMSYDPHRHGVTVRVVDEAGRLCVADVVYESERGESEGLAKFVNRYEATGSMPADIEVAKVMRGRGLRPHEFSFTIEGIDGVGTSAAEADAKLIATDRSFANPKAREGLPAVMKKLSNLFFTQVDAGKTFSYLIDEVDDEAAADRGVTYDGSQYRVDVEVLDAGTGSLQVAPRVFRVRDASGNEALESIEGLRVTFENRYQAKPVTVDDTAVLLPLTKRLEGREWRGDDLFVFTMRPARVNGKEDAESLAAMPLPQDGASVGVTEENPSYQPVGVAADPATKVFGYRDITFTEPGSYEYLVQEEIPADAVNPRVYKGGKRYADAIESECALGGWCKDGLTYDSRAATVTFKVADDGRGQLVLEHIGLDPSSVPTFVNKYRVPDVPIVPPVDPPVVPPVVPPVDPPVEPPVVPPSDPPEVPPVEPAAPEGSQSADDVADRPAREDGHEALPGTGDESYRAVAALACAGTCAVIMGILLRHRVRKR